MDSILISADKQKDIIKSLWDFILIMLIWGLRWIFRGVAYLIKILFVVEGIKTPPSVHAFQLVFKKSRPQIYDIKILNWLRKVDFENFITAKASHRLLDFSISSIDILKFEVRFLVGCFHYTQYPLNFKDCWFPINFETHNNNTNNL